MHNEQTRHYNVTKKNKKGSTQRDQNVVKEGEGDLYYTTVRQTENCSIESDQQSSVSLQEEARAHEGGVQRSLLRGSGFEMDPLGVL